MRLALVVLLAALLTPVLAHAQQKIAVVDMERAVSESEEGKKALAALQAEANRKKAELEKQRDELKRANDELQKQAVVLKPEALATKQQELQQKAMQFQEKVMRAEQELQQRQEKALQPVQQKIAAAVAQIATRDKITLVLRAEAVIWHLDPTLDITDEVVKKANEIKAPGK